MPIRRGLAGMAAAFLFATGVAAAFADPPLTSTGDTTTTTTTTTVPSTSPPPTTAAPTTTAATTTIAPTTTVAAATTTTASQPASAAFSLSSDCPIAAVVIARPNGAPSAIGGVVTPRARSTRVDTLVYPASGAIAKASTVELAQRSCTHLSGRASIRSLSLFRGAVTAGEIDLTVGRTTRSTIAGLVVNGKHVSAGVVARVPLPWGYVVAASHTPVAIGAARRAIAAIAVHVSRTHAGLPPGTTVLVAAAGMPTVRAAQRKPAKHHGKRATHEPLKVTPSLEVRGLLFPVVGPAAYGDTYGAFRSDVPGNWHHGDDIFAPLGTPVVAVAGGTINRVGWEKLGGWRLWVRDSVGDEFYYAHLSGYAPTDLHSNRVTAGQVIGFIGNTGDAFTTSPHLHFEIHPRPLLHLAYDGAVDPTTYLNNWPHLRHAHAPRPTHPPLPKAPLMRREAVYVFRELLAARHLIKHAPSASARPNVPIPAGANGFVTNAAALPVRETAAPYASDPSTLIVALLLCAAAAAAAATAAVRWRRRPEAAPPEPPQ